VAARRRRDVAVRDDREARGADHRGRDGVVGRAGDALGDRPGVEDEPVEARVLEQREEREDLLV
jgi:hypothetical protein